MDNDELILEVRRRLGKEKSRLVTDSEIEEVLKNESGNNEDENNALVESISGGADLWDSRDPGVTQQLFKGLTKQHLSTMISYFISTEDVLDNSGYKHGTSKWSYGSNNSFDSILFNGCPNCGAQYNLQEKLETKTELSCSICGHKGAPCKYKL